MKIERTSLYVSKVLDIVGIFAPQQHFDSINSMSCALRDYRDKVSTFEKENGIIFDRSVLKRDKSSDAFPTVDLWQKDLLQNKILNLELEYPLHQEYVRVIKEKFDNMEKSLKSRRQITLRRISIALILLLCVSIYSFTYYQANRYEMNGMLRIDKYDNTFEVPKNKSR